MSEKKVIVANWNGEDPGQERFVEIAERILYPVIKRQICFRVPHQERVRLVRDGKFHIHIWATSEENRFDRKVPPEKIYGIRVDCKDAAFQPLGTEKSDDIFYCPNTKYAVAELIEDNLFIHHDICHRGTKEESQIFETLCKDVADSIALGSEKLLRKVQKELDEVRAEMAKSKKEFVKICCRHYDKALEEADCRLSRGKEQVESLHGRMKECQKLKEEALKRIEFYAGEGSIQVSTFAAEYDKLIKIPGVLGVDVVSDSIHIYTNNITITEKGITYFIGKFRIEIPILLERSTLKFFNLTNDGKGPGAKPPKGFEGNTEYNRHHPHVKEGGVACLGNIGNALANYIKEYQYSVVAIIAIQFLKSVNTEDGAGKGIKWWPRA